MSARRSQIGWAAALLAPCALALALGAPDLGRPGLYYDEVIQAQPALQFLAVDGRPSQIPGITSTRLFGGWFPWMTQPYMGALKSQLLIPTFAVFGATVESLRATTLAWGILGLLLAVLWARRAIGASAAVVGGLLLAVDPSFLFIARHDWGSFSLALVCRSGGLLLLTVGWGRRSLAALAGGGLLFGLGLYNKIDFGVFLAAAGVAWVAAAPEAVADALRARRGQALAVLAGFAVGVAPLAGALRQTLLTARAVAGRQTLGSADWSEKLHTLVTTLDGSYFERLMRAGGSFEDMFSTDAVVGSPFLWVFAAAALWLGLRLLRSRRDLPSGVVFVWAASLLTLLGTFLTPRAVRIHHALGVYPLPHFVVAAAAVDLWSRAARPRLARSVAALAVALCLLGSLALDVRTRGVVDESGGKGRWSDALARFADDLDPGARVVTLDWGFEQPLRFLAPGRPVLETIWALRQSAAPLALDGTPEDVYLLYPAPYDVFPYGAEFLDALRALPPGVATTRTHLDQQGDPAFVSVRIARPHRLVYRGGFEVSLR